MLRTLLNFFAQSIAFILAAVFMLYVLYGFCIPEREEKDITPAALWHRLVD